MSKKLCLTLISAAILSACVSTKPAMEMPVNQEMPKAERVAQTAKVSSWEISGAMAAKTAQKGWSAALNWQQKGPGAYDIRLMGPLGGGSVIISKSGNTVTFKDGNKITRASSADELLQKQTGVRVPVNSLYYWVRGLPAPGKVQAMTYDHYNHLNQLKQAGYTIEYLRYTSVQGTDLPSMIKLQGHGLMVKLVIKNWKV